jgi:hypothetical protein
MAHNGHMLTALPLVATVQSAGTALAPLAIRAFAASHFDPGVCPRLSKVHPIALQTRGVAPNAVASALP